MSTAVYLIKLQIENNRTSVKCNPHISTFVRKRIIITSYIVEIQNATREKKLSFRFIFLLGYIAWDCRVQRPLKSLKTCTTVSRSIRVITCSSPSLIMPCSGRPPLSPPTYFPNMSLISFMPRTTFYWPS